MTVGELEAKIAENRRKLRSAKISIGEAVDLERQIVEWNNKIRKLMTKDAVSRGVVRGMRDAMKGTSFADISENARGMMERKAAMIAEAQAGVDRMSQLLTRVENARKIIKKRGDTPYNGYAAGAADYVKRARASFSLAITSLNNGSLYKHSEMMSAARDPERVAIEATQAIERQAGI